MRKQLGVGPLPGERQPGLLPSESLIGVAKPPDSP
jgi:hypothetical protein